MNSLTKSTHWLKVIALIGVFTSASFSVQAADREDVVAGVLLGTAAGYILAEHGAHLKIGYRQGDFGHHHHTRYCKHDRHHAKFDRYHRDYGHSHGHKHGHKYDHRYYHSGKHHRDDRYYGNRGRHDGYRDHRGEKHGRPIASKPQHGKDFSKREKRMVSSRY